MTISILLAASDKYSSHNVSKQHFASLVYIHILFLPFDTRVWLLSSKLLVTWSHWWMLSMQTTTPERWCWSSSESSSPLMRRWRRLYSRWGMGTWILCSGNDTQWMLYWMRCSTSEESALLVLIWLHATHSRLFNQYVVSAGLVVRYMNTNMRISGTDLCVLSVLTLHPLVTFTLLCLNFRSDEILISLVWRFPLWPALVLFHRWWNSVVALMVWKQTTLKQRSCPPSSSTSGNTGWLWIDATTDRLAITIGLQL